MTDINQRAEVDDRGGVFSHETGEHDPRNTLTDEEVATILAARKAAEAAKAAEAVPDGLSGEEAALIRQYRAEATAKSAGTPAPAADDLEYQQFLNWKKSGKPDYRTDEEIARDNAMSSYDKDLARGAFSHYLTLADGTTRKHLAVDSGPVPASVDGIPVTSVAHAAVGQAA